MLLKVNISFRGWLTQELTMMEVNRYLCVLIYRRKPENYFKSPEERRKFFRLGGGREVKA